MKKTVKAAGKAEATSAMATANAITVRVKRCATRHRIGESHPRAKLSDHDVELMRELHADHKVKPKELAEKFECPIDTVYSILAYRSRYGIPGL